MPELPEVETVVRQLGPLVEGKRIRHLCIFDARLDLSNPEEARGRRLNRIGRHGKHIVMELGTLAHRAGRIFLIIHLRMTGRLTWQDHFTLSCKRQYALSEETRLQAAPVRACWTFDDGILCFKDVRRFGTIRMTSEWLETMPAGIDPLSKGLTARGLQALMAGSKTPIKIWLLRQDRLSGMGNIYASESLFRAGLHPAREAGSLGASECGRLLRSIRKVLRTAIDVGGTTFSTFQDVYGAVGSYQHNLQVYDHEGDDCPDCGRSIMRIVQAQRSTYFCPHCQRA